MKDITKTSRLAGELEKAFRLINKDFFNDELPTPIITITPTAKVFAHYSTFDAWHTGKGDMREINISSAYLDRPLENIIASLTHEMCHMFSDCVLNEQDTSRQGTYHNKIFRREAEAHGLICTRTDRYGWSHTEPSDELILWTWEHDELKEISMCRTLPTVLATGSHSNNSSNSLTTVGKNTNSHSRKFVCPCCQTTLRATRQGTINIICGDCKETFIEC